MDPHHLFFLSFCLCFATSTFGGSSINCCHECKSSHLFCLFFFFWFFFWGFFSPSFPFWIWPSKRCTIQFFLHCSHLFMYKNGWWWWHSNDCFKQCYDFSQLLELVGTYRFVRKIIFSDDSRGGGGGKPFKLHLNQNCYILGINHNFVGFKILVDFSIGLKRHHFFVLKEDGEVCFM